MIQDDGSLQAFVNIFVNEQRAKLDRSVSAHDELYVMQAISGGGDGAELLVGYTLDGTSPSTITHPAEQLRTLSGIGLGDTVDDVESAYSRVEYRDVDEVPAFLVLSSEDGRTLIWGTLDTDDPARVISISSPRVCDGGPFSNS